MPQTLETRHASLLHARLRISLGAEGEPALRVVNCALRHWRRKAVEIANAVLEREGDEAKAIRIGIAKAKEWAMHHVGGERAQP